jgi:transmembrane sensor
MTIDDEDSAPFSDDDISDQAIGWIVRLRSGGATPADHAGYAAWRRRTPAHEAAAQEAEALWRDLPRTRLATRLAEGHPPAGDRWKRAARWTAFGGLVAASLVLCGIGWMALGPMSGIFADFSTHVGDRRSVQLPDSSIAELNTATALSVAYSARERRVILHAGEARFDIASDLGRPFVVVAGDGEVQAVGTVFDVRQDGAEVSVLVVEGAADVRQGSAAAVRVTAGEGVRYGPARPLAEPEAMDVTAATAWHRGKLIFNRRPLADVVAELQRYRVGRVVISDSRLSKLEVTGVFDLDDIEGLLQTIEQTLAVRVIRLPLLTIIG